MTKQARLATFAISTVDNLCLLQQYKWITIKIRLPRLITNAPYGSNFLTFLTFSSVAEKTGPCQEVIGSLSNNDGDGYEKVTLIRQIFEFNSEGLYQSSGKEKESCCLVFPSSTKREIRHFHDVVVHVQSCCFANLTYCLFAVLVAVAVVVFLNSRFSGRRCC